MRNSHSFVHSSYSLKISLLVGQRALVDESGVISSWHHHHSPHIHVGDEQQASDGRGSETSVSLHIINQSINHNFIETTFSHIIYISTFSRRTLLQRVNLVGKIYPSIMRNFTDLLISFSTTEHM
jgi:hypothetical protein